MKMDLLYLLPALALLICLTGAVLPSKYQSTYVKAGKEHRRYSSGTIITARFTAVALLIATAITMIWPVSGVDSLFQGLVITFICLIPLIAYQLVTFIGRLLFGKRRRKSARRRRRLSYRRNDEMGTAELDKTVDISQLQGQGDIASIETAAGDANADSGQVPVVSRSPGSGTGEEGKRARADIARVKSNSAEGVLHGLDPASHSSRDEPTVENSSPADSDENSPQKQQKPKQDPEVREQMDRVSTLVKSYDLGDEKADRAKRNARSMADSSIGSNTNVSNPGNNPGIVSKDNQSTDLASHNEQALQVSRTEALRKVIATLQEDKRKLQRLVIAQQAAFDSERQSHERTRHVARDAIKVMRDARSGQRMAEKIARRERAERRRLEKEYTKVTRALKNAMSTLANAEQENAGKDSTSAA